MTDSKNTKAETMTPAPVASVQHGWGVLRTSADVSAFIAHRVSKLPASTKSPACNIAKALNGANIAATKAGEPPVAPPPGDYWTRFDVHARFGVKL